jgi:hypothetical protein
MGANNKPMRSRVGSTVLGIKIGCQALIFCCLNAMSEAPSASTPMWSENIHDGRFKILTFFFTAASSPSRGSSFLFFRLINAIGAWYVGRLVGLKVYVWRCSNIVGQVSHIRMNQSRRQSHGCPRPAGCQQAADSPMRDYIILLSSHLQEDMAEVPS